MLEYGVSHMIVIDPETRRPIGSSRRWTSLARWRRAKPEFGRQVFEMERETI